MDLLTQVVKVQQLQRNIITHMKLKMIHSKLQLHSEHQLKTLVFVNIQFE